MERLIKNVLDTLAGLGSSEQVALFTIQEGSTVAILAGGFSAGEFVLPGKHMDLKGTPLEEIILTGQAKTYPGAITEGIPFPNYEETHSGFECFCMPLMDDKSQLVGIAILSQDVGVSAPDYRLQTLGMLRTLIASAMENARLFQLATIDGLTGLYVRRYLEIRLQEEFTRLRRHGGVLSLLMIGIDHFIELTDSYGHEQGDKVLQVIADLIIHSTRHEIDLPCRYSTDKLLLMLPHTDLNGAYILAERIRQRCAALEINTAGQGTVKITVSAGIAELNKSSEISKDELIRRAELMLKAAKQAGYNQVMKYGRAP